MKKQYEIELKKIEYGYVIVKANNEQDAINKYNEEGGNEIFFPDNQEIKIIGTVTETDEFFNNSNNSNNWRYPSIPTNY